MNIKLIIIAYLIVLIKPDCEPDRTELVQLKKLREYDDCVSRTSQGELDEGGYYKCCHLYYQHDSNNLYEEVDTCILITQNQYDNIKKWVDDFENYEGVESVHIHCKGFGIQYNLLLALLILLYLL